MSAIPTISETVDIGRVSTYLAANYNARGRLFGGNLNRVSEVQIAMYTDALDWATEGAQTDATTRNIANYLFWLCGMFAVQAISIIAGGGGGSVTPVNPPVGSIYPFVITSSNFEADGKTYVNEDIVGDNIMLFINEWTQTWLLAPGAFSYTATGFVINNGVGQQMEGFDANTNDYTIVVQKKNNG
jgi:hypothetical protein